MPITKSNWSGCKKILCIRPDNMGDLIMTGPAIRALKLSFGAEITVLTSSAAAPIAGLIEEVDDLIIFDLPWVKNNVTSADESISKLVEMIRQQHFDAAVIFTVYSQNPMPTVMLAYLSGIPKRLAYCRENPYQLLTDWVPDREPYNYIRHQVKRDLDLITAVGASSNDDSLALNVKQDLWSGVEDKLKLLGLDITKKWLILHAGVSETKREYPTDKWVSAGKKIINDLAYQILFTGSATEKSLTDGLKGQIGKGSYSSAGIFNIDELVVLIKNASLMLSVNTGTVHIAAAVGTPVVVLYALTNPQHTPWGVPAKVLPFKIAKELSSRNQVIEYVSRLYDTDEYYLPDAGDIIAAIAELMEAPAKFMLKGLVMIKQGSYLFKN